MENERKIAIQENYLEINKKSWDARLSEHLQSEFYDVHGFLEGKTSLKKIELGLLGDVKGKSILHLQCHFGQDTISLSRLGANVTGVDFSEKSIQKAKELAEKAGSDANFVCADIYELPQLFKGQFDIVFTSYGTIIWLPDLNRWATTIQHFLKPNGALFFIDFHPFVWMFDDNLDQIIYPYNNKGAIIEEQKGSYTDPNADIEATNVTWNHGMAEVITALLDKGLALEEIREYDYSPYPFVKHCERINEETYIVKKFGDKAPLVYSIKATKRV